MTNIEKLDGAAMEYFYSLPPLFQEQIIESGVTFNSREEIENYYNAAVKESSSEK